MSVVITVFGNSGKSTVAVNLAVALAKSDAVVGIIGTNLSYGSLQSFFGMKIEQDKSLKRAIDISVECDIVKTFSQYPKLKNLFILSLANTEDALTISSDISESDGKRLIFSTKDSFDYLIIDATSDYRQSLTFLGLIHADKIINVFTPDLEDALFQIAHVNLFNRLNLQNKTISVLDNYDNSMPISVIESDVRRKADIILPFTKEMKETINTGVPLVLKGASCTSSNKYIKGINELALLIKEDGSNSEINKKFSFFRRREKISSE